ncbi:Phomenoic acid biosynthesis cluster-specific transcriptional regulator-like protein [Cladobotryum mycophilum]|uniref:Phomenoic acid biosynthesis cluster-specific transcriptional regulator-like protein n=1 Tax=Cladobotryum mycophilum TaxID=491253 RepID=A0ABR0S7C2_9HYPO
MESTTSQPKPTSKQCWGCLRRRKECDGALPTCNTCRRADIVCPGYRNVKPLTWLRTGKVSRLEGSKILNSSESATSTPKFVSVSKPLSPPASDVGSIGLGANDDEEINARIEQVRQVVTQAVTTTTLEPRSSRRQRPKQSRLPSGKASTHHTLVARRQHDGTSLHRPLWYGDRDTIGYLDICNYMSCLDLNSRQVLPSNVEPSPPVTFSDWQLMRPCTQQALKAITVGFRIIRESHAHGVDVALTDSGPVSGLWAKFYHHIGRALFGVNDDIAILRDIIGLESIVMSIWLLIIAEGWFSDSLSWRPHAVGFWRLLESHGGLGRVAAHSPSLGLPLRDCLVFTTAFNTTSPSHDLIAEASRVDLNDAYLIYRVQIHLMFYCPPALFLDIIRISRLRLELATNDSSCSDGEPSSFCHLLGSIDSYSMHTMLMCWPRTDDLFFTIAQIFRSAVAVYGNLTVPCIYSACDCQKLREFHRDNLFHLIRTVVNYPVHAVSIFWPLVVAGVAARTGDERGLIGEHILSIVHGIYNHGTGPIVALAVLRKFWESGKTEWDECFDRPYSIMA